jgi:hypothetical protein
MAGVAWSMLPELPEFCTSLKLRAAIGPTGLFRFGNIAVQVILGSNSDPGRDLADRR